MKPKIVKLAIQDEEIRDTYYLVNPDKDKLAELKNMIEHRFDYQYADNLTDEEIGKAEQFCDNIWEEIDKFIVNNFVVLTIDEIYEIAY
jgi:hypothetical protein